MAAKVQIVFDCENPKALSEFWAEALGYKLDDPPSGFATWQEALKAWGVPEERWNSASAVVDPAGVGPRLFFQQLDNPKRGKNRVHLDIEAGGELSLPREERDRRIDAEVARLEGLGAVRQREGEEFARWVVMLDPEGNEFCVV
jgi:hypothetical protein